MSGEAAFDRYIAEIRENPVLDREEEAELARRIRAGDEAALDRLVASNLRFVVSVARRYAGRGVSLDELVNEGNLGLVRAARRFDESRGVRFVSYAVWWIRQAMLSVLAVETSVVRVPSGRWQEARQEAAARRRVSQRVGRRATTAEVAAELGWTDQRVCRARAARRTDLSLDAPAGLAGDADILDILPDRGDDPDRRLQRSALAQALRRSLARLPETEADVVRRYYGLDGEPPATLREIGSSLGFSRERAGAIRDRALVRLRLEEAGRDLQGFRIG